ncbi:hypothetical protein CK218_23325 [Mesorhizobium sp. WSM3879]|uniref:hypothetical protein n=1 Tax=Mesorhizobium sp. WSM3879 TaxID=2029406 RepID=UPI000BB048C5|nr:hypothetical protein [Mesorhizobium sp. WSM3879]PBB78624.1 hypothetical protein CK218_23325 [Mesorhizobium sp. WSM3879]
MEDVPLSLYLDLKPGEKADLEVVAQAVLHWVSGLRSAASAIDPSVQVRIELLNASEGSLSLNTFLSWAEGQLAQIHRGGKKYPRLYALAIGLALFVGDHVGGHYLDEFISEEPVISLSEEDRALLRELVKRAAKAPEVHSQSRRFFRSLEHDPSISGVGITERHGTKPKKMIPSAEFAQHSGLWSIEEDELERTLRPVLDVILISPVLLPRPRSWTFRPEGLPEFQATMKDRRFLAALDKDHVQERLRTGIPMTIRLEVKEKKVDGDWVPQKKGRSVIEVISPSVD